MTDERDKKTIEIRYQKDLMTYFDYQADPVSSKVTTTKVSMILE